MGKEISSLRELIVVRQDVFLRTVFEGEKSLYQFTDHERILFYIKEKNEYVFLGYKKYIDSRQVIKENRGYISQLSEYLSDCPKVQKDFVSLKYEIKALEKIFTKYYACTAQKIDFKKTVDKSKTSFGLIGGISFSKLNFLSSSGTFGYLADAKFNNSLVFSVGVTHKITFPRNLRRISLINELVFSTPYQNKGLWDDFASEHNYIIHKGLSHKNLVSKQKP